jgi:hypothetical protein
VTAIPAVTKALGGSKEEALTATWLVGTGAGAGASVGWLRPEQAETLANQTITMSHIIDFFVLPHFIASHPRS